MTFYGPAFVAAVAYVDPGNFATDFQSGARYGYLLAWVLVAACLVAMFIQYLSAKTGLATGRDLATLCRENFRRPVVLGLWVQAECVAVATDLAEFIGACIGLDLLFGIPMPVAALIAGVVSFGILAFPAAWPPSLRTGHHLPARGGRTRIRLHPVRGGRAVRPGPGRRDVAGLQGHGLGRPGHRDHRGDGHAAPHLPALGADRRAPGS
ncbi:hypothetical protein GCM10017771_60930 [Streptomyces capitiformicae]|uniref:Uncharacterized protein n=1 Tax=Streptomyces capitiformicae TaxID=2014920 RepID=A0A919DH19_9ACTN|nr:hypothetical protein GCM10017771_60930 [Streptomyces capitiformicae]